MTPREFQTFALAILGSAQGWQSRIARKIGVSDRTVRRWLAGNPIPEEISEKLKNMVGANDISPWPRDEWVIGDGVTADGHHREYIMHLMPPRFAARIVALNDDGAPLPEHPANTEQGIVYIIDDNTLLCEIDWIDAPRDGEIVPLLEAAATAIDRA